MLSSCTSPPQLPPPTIPASEMSCFLAQEPGLIYQALKKAQCSLWRLLFLALCNCWRCRLHPSWLSTREKCSEMLGPGFGFLVLWSANPRAKRTGLDSIPCSPITWITAEPARYNESHVLIGVGRWELPLLSSFHRYHGAEKTKNPLSTNFLGCSPQDQTSQGGCQALNK